jgi:hypothetical protein
MITKRRGGVSKLAQVSKKPKLNTQRYKTQITKESQEKK